MVGEAIGAGIQGFFQGKDWREGRDSRRRAEERQTRLDELIFTREARDVEEHQRRMAEFDRIARENERLAAQRAEMAGVFGAAGAATDASLATSGMGAVPIPPAAPSAMPAQMPPPAGAAISYTSGAVDIPAFNQEMSDLLTSATRTAPATGPAMTAASTMPASAATRADLTFGLGAAGLPPGRTAVSSPTTPQAATGPADAPLPDAPGAAAGYSSVQAIDRQIADRQAQLSTQGFPARDIPSPGQADAFEATQAAIADLQKARAAEIARINTTMGFNGMGAAEPAAAPEMITKGPTPLAFGAVQAPAGATAPTPRRDPAPAATSQDEKRMASSASATVQGGISPAIAATDRAAVASGDAALGAVTPSTRGGLSEEKRAQAAGDWLSHYADVGAPMVIEAMLKQGNLEGAIQFQEFMDSAQSKAAMQSWAEAAIAAQVGDMDTFAEKVVQTYNNSDYFGDGLTIVEGEENTGFTRDEAGNITGAVVTFRNEASGETFEQVFNDPQDMVNFGLVALSPEEAFKHYAEQAAAQSEARVAAADTAKEDASDRQERIDAITKTILETQIGTTPEAAMASATAIVDGASTPAAAAVGPPPILRRP